MPEQNPFFGAGERARQGRPSGQLVQPVGNRFLGATQRVRESGLAIGAAEAAEPGDTQLARGDKANPFVGSTRRQRDKLGEPLPAPASPSFLESAGTFAKEAIPQAAGGALDALEQAADTMERILPLGTFELSDGGIRHRAVDPKAERGFPEVAPAETTGGGLVRGVSQFLTGFVPAFRAMRGVGALGGASKVGQFVAQAGRGEAAAQVADQLVFSPHEDRLSNLVQEYPALANPVTEYLAATPGDSEAEARFKVALEGLGLGAAVGGFTEALGLMRRARTTKGAGTASGTRQEPFLGPEPQTPGQPGSRASESPAASVPPSTDDLPAKARELLERLNPSKPRTLEDIARERAVEAEGLVRGGGPSRVVETSQQSFLGRTLDDIDRALEEEKLSDRQKLVKALGSEDAANRFEQLDRRRNSSNPRIADEASDQFDREFDDLSPEQERLVYGVGETNLSVEELTEIRRAFIETDFFKDENVQAIAFEAAVGLRDLRAADLKAALAGGGNGLQQARTIRFMRAFHALRGRGLDEALIQRELVGGLQRIGFSEADAFEVVTRNLDELRSVDTPPRQVTGPVDEGDEFDLLIDVARGTRKAPRKPRTLTRFLHAAGGLKNQGGELRALDITARSRPGLVNNTSGLPLDEAGLRAWEAGFLPEFSQRPTVAEFLDALDEDFRGTRPHLDPADADLADLHSLLGEVDELVSRADLNLDELSNAEVRAHLQGLANEPTPRTLPDLEGEAARQRDALAGGIEAGPIGARAANINLENIQTGDDAKRVLQETADIAASQMDEARRGVVSEDQTQALADQLGMTPEKLLKRRRGQAFNAEEALAARGLLTASSEQLARLAKAAIGGSDEALAKFQQAFARHVAIQEQVAGMTAEAGRALKSFQFVAKSDAAKARALQQIVDSGGGRDGIEELAGRIADIDNPDALNTFTREAFKATKREKVFELWINALLSGPRTHAVNILSNTLTSLWTLPEHALASGIGAVRRGGDKVYLRETGHRAFGWVEGVKDGLAYLAKALRTGESSFDDLTKVEVRRHRAIPGVVGEVVRLPGRFLQAEDDFFKAIGYRMEMRSQAVRDGLKKGLKGRELAQHVDQVLRDPPDDIRIKSIDAAHYLTFTKRLGPKGRWVQQLANDIPGGRVVLPFIRTPANIIKFAGERSPLAPAFKEFRDAMRAGGAERDLAVSRMTLGSGIGAVMASLAAEGQITGGGPSHGPTRNLQRANGWMPYSVKIGDQYYSYGRLEPLGMLMGVSADFAEISGQISAGEADKIGTLIVGSISKNLLSKTWLRGPSELIQALQDPDRYGQRWLLQLAGTAVPTGIAQISQTQDPVLRSTRPEAVDDPLLAEAQALINRIKSRLPGYSKDLPPVRNVFGEPVIYGGGLGPDLVSPVFMSTDRNDPVIEEMLDLKVTPGTVRREIGGVKLTPEQYDQYAQLAGKPMKTALRNLMARPEYGQLPVIARRKLVRQIITSTRDSAREQMLAAHPELLQKGVERKVEKVTAR